jgi:hypothetical protein
MIADDESMCVWLIQRIYSFGPAFTVQFVDTPASALHAYDVTLGRALRTQFKLWDNDDAMQRSQLIITKTHNMLQ